MPFWKIKKLEEPTGHVWKVLVGSMEHLDGCSRSSPRVRGWWLTHQCIPKSASVYCRTLRQLYPGISQSALGSCRAFLEVLMGCTDKCFSSEGHHGCFLLSPDAPPEVIWLARLESQLKSLGKSSFLHPA